MGVFRSAESFGRHLLDEHWRKTPAVARQLLAPSFIKKFDAERFLKWTDQTLGSVRVFENYLDGTAQSALLSKPNHVRSYFKELNKSGAGFTFHMNDVELIDQEIFFLRQCFGIPFWWRLDDVIATLSTPESGIGYHAGHEDGIIVQLSGSRRWRVWDQEQTPINYRYELLMPTEGPNPKILKPNAGCDKILDVYLSPGDVLYIPPYFPHEGVTTETSVSLSIAWKGLGPASFIPKPLFMEIMPVDRVELIKKSTTLFDESLTAFDAIQTWEAQSANLAPEHLRREFQGCIHDAIENHILALTQRYCTS